MPATRARWSSALTAQRLRAELALGRTPAEVADQVGCSENTVRDHLARHGLLDVGQLPETLAADYDQLGGIALVAERHEVSFSTARRWLLAIGVELSEAHRPIKKDIDIEAAVLRYIAGDSLARISVDLGVGVNTTKRRLQAAGVTMRARGRPPAEE